MGEEVYTIKVKRDNYMVGHNYEITYNLFNKIDGDSIENIYLNSKIIIL